MKKILITIVLAAVVAAVYLAQKEVRPNPIPTKMMGNESEINIILSPHLDDAILSLGGFISSKPSKVVVATFFAGTPHTPVTTDWDTISGFKNSDETHRARMKENENALKDVEKIEYDYLDYQYDLGRSERALEERIVADIETLIERHKGKNIAIFGPNIFPADVAHPDHLVVHKALYKVSRSITRDNVSFYFYEDIPYAPELKNKYGLTVEEFLTKNHRHNSIILFAIPLTETLLEQKINRVKFYPSQIKALSYNQKPLLEVIEKYAKERCTDIGLSLCEATFKVESR